MKFTAWLRGFHRSRIGQGQRFWLIAAGTLDGDRAELQALATEGGAFPPAFDLAAIEHSTAELQWQTDDAEAFADR